MTSTLRASVPVVLILAQALAPSTVWPPPPVTVPSLGSRGAPPQPQTVPSLGPRDPQPPSVPSLGPRDRQPLSVPSVGIRDAATQPGSAATYGVGADRYQPASVGSQ